ncbi:hypothetical protein PINS_up010266 [Pythium insidiosum]|nr:hypothetical protein PINS_up010266 [Pythium insidiosum]
MTSVAPSRGRRVSLLSRRRLTRAPSGIGSSSSDAVTAAHSAAVNLHAIATVTTTPHAWLHAGATVLIVLRNASVCVALTWGVAWAIANGDLVAAARRLPQRDDEFLLGTLVTSHVVCCTAITLVQASLLLHTHLLTPKQQPTTPRTTLSVSTWRIARRAFPWFALSLVMLIAGAKGLWRLGAPHARVRELKLPFYFMWIVVWLYNLAIDLIGRYVYRYETVEGRRSRQDAQHRSKLAAIAPATHTITGSGAAVRAASGAGLLTVATGPRPPPLSPPRSNLRRTLSALRRVAKIRTPLYVAILAASAGTHALSHWVLRSQLEVLLLMVGSLVVKLVVQSVARRTLLRRNIKNIRTMFLAATPATVLLDTQTRLMLQRARNTQLTVVGTVVMAIVEIALRVVKSVLLRHQIATWEQQRSRQWIDTATASGSASGSARKLRRIASRVASERDDHRYGAKLLAYRSAELFADMSAEYIAMGCSSAVLFFCWDHRHYVLSAGVARDERSASLSSSSSSASESDAVDTTWSATRTWILLAQVLGEVLVDLLSCVFEVAHGLRFDGVQQQRAYLAFLFVVAAVGNVAISSGVYLRIQIAYIRSDDAELLSRRCQTKERSSMEPAVMSSIDEATIERALKRWRDVTTPLDHESVDHDAAVIASPSRFPRTRTDSATTRSTSSSSSSSSSFCAWSHGEFLARVATFAVSTWVAKPLVLSPLACARHGWRNVGPEMLRCSSCEQFLCCFIDDSLGDDGVARVANAFAKQLASGHASDCFWRENPSPESFLVLPVLSPPQVLEALVRHVQGVVDTMTRDHLKRTAFQRLSIATSARSRVVDEKEKEERLCACLARRVSMPTNADDSIGGVSEMSLLWNVALVCLAGWKLELLTSDTAAEMTLHCELCNRHVPLTIESNDGDDNTISRPPAKRQRVGDRDSDHERERESDNTLDPIAQHRWFCPWVNEQQRSDETTTRLRELLTLLPERADATPIETFIRLPGWQQNALALECLLTEQQQEQLEEQQQHQQQQQTATSTSSARGDAEEAAEQALSTVQAILSLTEHPL